MTVTELTKDIYEKYPKVFSKFLEYLMKNLYDNSLHVNGEKLFLFNYHGEIYLIPFSMLYGLLEDFFEENRIIITIDYYSNNGTYYRMRLLNKETAMYFGSWREYRIDGNKSKNKAKYNAILKACEILERKL